MGSKRDPEVYGQGEAILRMGGLLTKCVGEAASADLMGCLGVRGFVQRVVPTAAATAIHAAVQQGSEHNLHDYYKVTFPRERSPHQPGTLIRIGENW